MLWKKLLLKNVILKSRLESATFNRVVMMFFLKRQYLSRDLNEDIQGKSISSKGSNKCPLYTWYALRTEQSVSLEFRNCEAVILSVMGSHWTSFAEKCLALYLLILLLLLKIKVKVVNDLPLYTVFVFWLYYLSINVWAWWIDWQRL